MCPISSGLNEAPQDDDGAISLTYLLWSEPDIFDCVRIVLISYSHEKTGSDGGGGCAEAASAEGRRVPPPAATASENFVQAETLFPTDLAELWIRAPPGRANTVESRRAAERVASAITGADADGQDVDISSAKCSDAGAVPDFDSASVRSRLILLHLRVPPCWLTRWRSTLPQSAAPLFGRRQDTALPMGQRFQFALRLGALRALPASSETSFGQKWIHLRRVTSTRAVHTAATISIMISVLLLLGNISSQHLHPKFG